MINVELQYKLLEKLKISQAQLFYLICIHEKKYDLLVKYGKLYNVPKNAGYIGAKAYLELKNYELIKTDNNNVDFCTDKFTDLYVDKYTAFYNLKQVYPDFSNINGKKVPLQSANEETYSTLYIKKINGSLIEHKEILKDVIFAIEHNINFTSLKNFIESRTWLSYRKARNNEELKSVSLDKTDLNLF